jgi:hypothetical protein
MGNPLNAELNPICHLLALLGGATIVVISRLRVKIKFQTSLGCHLSQRKLAECNRIQVVWVPRHTGSDGNDMGDQLARQISLHPPTGHESAFGLSPRVAGGVIRDGTSRKHEEHWQSTCGQRQAKGFFGRLLLKEVENY